MAKIMLQGYQCERCEHTWIPREASTEEPKVCPKCKSPYWNTPRREKAAKKGRKAR
jgi:predicted Zn-ribbon and HTH transcriptional regulator